MATMICSAENINLEVKRIFNPSEIKEAILEVGILPIVKSNKKIEYYNVPVAFDIEVSSFIQNENKKAIMYIWTLSLRGIIIQGRRWQEFIDCCNYISEWYELNDNKRIVFYVHNLSYEFQFFHKYFNFTKVFSLKKRAPIQAITDLGIEFRCSYKLSGYSLGVLAKQLIKYKIRKLVGDLDYSLLRNSKTVMTKEEIDYCINDVQIIIAYIDEYLDRVKYIYDIPLTKTGAVRKLTRNYCFYNNGNKKENKDTFKKYRSLMRNLTLNTETYTMLKNAFAGGFTHGNAIHAMTVLRNVRSFDFTSSYPAVMLSEKFPMSAPKEAIITSDKEFRKYLDSCCCFFNIEIEGLRPKVINENYISKSHCISLKGAVLNNGRVVSADKLIMTVTEQDYYIIEEFYEWDNMYIGKFYYMLKGYLPKNFVLAILDLYEKKTVLKDVIGHEVEYLVSKENINSMFGMCVTDICRDKIIYNPVDWTTEKPDIDEAIHKENKSIKRFLFYAWGVWITAYARYNLFTAICELGDDYVYADTDSVKFLNYENHKDYFEWYNKMIINKLEKAMKFHNIPIERTRPKNKNGKEKQIGIWDDEGTYTRFKFLGAKRYMVEKEKAWTAIKEEYNGLLVPEMYEFQKDGITFLALDVNLTVSGLNKGSVIPYLYKEYGANIFDAFSDELYIPPQYTGKNTHTYVDEPIKGKVKDYQGNIVDYEELSFIHLGGADYSLSILEVYLQYILGIQDEVTTL